MDSRQIPVKAVNQAARGLLLRRLVLACLCLVLALAFSGLAQPSLAQEVAKPRTLLEILFGIRKPAEPPAPPPPPKKKKPKNPAVDTSADKIDILPKRETAEKILVVGDFFAKGIAQGLDASFRASPGVAIETRSSGNAGIARDDLFDWQKLLPSYIADVKPVVIVMSLGANDRQQMKINGQKEKFKSELWNSEYERRVSAITRIAVDAKIPLLWVGLPSFMPSGMTADAVSLNAIIQNGVSKSGGEFIDIWEGFVDDAGQFIVSGSDVNGQQVRLRTADGIGLTEAGKRKVAFYIEKPARRILGTAADIGNTVIGQDSLPDLISLPPQMEPTKTVRTAPVNLTDPELDGGAALLGDRKPGGFSTGSVLPVTEAKAPKGRIDDFSMPAK